MTKSDFIPTLQQHTINVFYPTRASWVDHRGGSCSHLGATSTFSGCSAEEHPLRVL